MKSLGHSTVTCHTKAEHPGAVQSRRLNASAGPIRHRRQGGFLESGQPAVHIGSQKVSSDISERIHCAESSKGINELTKEIDPCSENVPLWTAY